MTLPQGCIVHDARCKAGRTELTREAEAEMQLAAGDHISPEEHVWRGERRVAIRAALRNLTPRERTVIVLRFGLEGYAPLRQRQVSELLGVSGERVRQLETKGMHKLARKSAGLRAIAGVEKRLAAKEAAAALDERRAALAMAAREAALRHERAMAQQRLEVEARRQAALIARIRVVSNGQPGGQVPPHYDAARCRLIQPEMPAELTPEAMNSYRTRLIVEIARIDAEVRSAALRGTWW